MEGHNCHNQYLNGNHGNAVIGYQQQQHQYQPEPHIAVLIEGGPPIPNGPIRNYRTIRRAPGEANPRALDRRTTTQYCCSVPASKIVFISAMVVSSSLLLIMFTLIMADAFQMHGKYHPGSGNEAKYF